MWVWILAIISLGLIWFGSWTASLFGADVPLWVRLLASAVVVVFVATVVLLRRWRIARAAKAFEREILKQSEQQAMYTRPDRRGEITNLRDQFSKGISSLKSSKLGGGRGAKALYALPWYVIIGPPGAGKTVALKKSGLTFAMDGEGEGVQGLGGTRNCDWWFTNDAILLDTAGRYATEGDDHNEWLAFLRLLKKFRSHKPINGVVVAVSITDLMGAGEDQLVNYARQLRARVDELMRELEMIVPIYLMFTKSDLIAGFVPMWNDLVLSEREQVMGATFPISGRDAPVRPGAAFAEKFDDILKVLHAKAVERASRVNDYAGRVQVLQFPNEFRRLRDTVGPFVDALFAPNRFQGTPIFRGFYFTSGTQEGNPVSRSINELAHAFGLPGVAPASAAQQEAKSYFVTNIFRRIMFPDQNVAARTRSQVRRRTISRLALASACLFVGLMIAVPSLVTFTRNRSVVQTASASAATAAEVNWKSDKPIAEKIEPITKIRKQINQLEDWEENGPPTALGWGMYVGDDLLGPLRDIYTAQLHQAFTVPTRGELETQLRAITSGSATTKSFSENYDRLKLYLMLTEPAKLDLDWATPQVTTMWAKALKTVNAEKDEKLLRPHARYYLELMKRGEARRWDADQVLIDATRKKLLETDRIERMYGLLIKDAMEEVAPIQHRDIFYGSISGWVKYEKDVKVPGAYTKEGYMRVRDILKSQQQKLIGEAWVLGKSDGAESKTLAEDTISKLRELYFDRYVDAWNAFILDIRIARPKDNTQALVLLRALSEPEWPYRRLIRILAENVRLTIEESELSKSAQEYFLRKKRQLAVKIAQKLRTKGPSMSVKPEARPTTPVENAFEPLLDFGAPPKTGNKNAPPAELAQYMGYLAKIVAQITDARDSSYADEEGIDAQFDDAARGTYKLLDEQTAFTRPMIEDLLLNPIHREGKRLPRKF